MKYIMTEPNAVMSLCILINILQVDWSIDWVNVLRATRHRL